MVAASDVQVAMGSHIAIRKFVGLCAFVSHARRRVAAARCARRTIAVLFALLLCACVEHRPEYPYLVECAAPEDGDVRLTWLGVAGLHISDGETGFLIDPFVSQHRASILRIAASAPLHSDKGRVDWWRDRLDPIDAIFVTHTHYDHALDAPVFAKAERAPVYGGETMGQIMQGHDAADLFHRMNAGDQVRIGQAGRFTIDVVRSAHGRGLGIGDLLGGEASAPVPPGAPVTAYRMGEVFALRIAHEQGAFVFLGSGAAVEGMFDPAGGADVAVLTLSARTPGPEYLRETVVRNGATKVVPIHFDDVFRLPTEPARVQRLAKFSAFVDELASIDREIGFAPQPLGKACALFRKP